MGTLIFTSPSNTNKSLFAQTADGPVVTGTVFSTLIGAGVGTLTVPANAFQVGDSFKASLFGHISCANNQDLIVKLLSSTSPLGGTGTISMPQCTNQHFQFDIQFTIRAVGGASTAAILTAGFFTYSKDASNAFEGADFTLLENTLFDTTVSQTLDIQAQWGGPNPANQIYVESFVLTKIF
jgi:hypothetical protein